MRFTLVLGFFVFSYAAISQVAQSTVKLERHYKDGEVVAYRMRGINQGHNRTIRYEARANGSVAKDQNQGFLEEFTWSDLETNGQSFTMSEPSQHFKEDLSLAPGFQLTVPDLSKVQPILIGPITDLLAFYADVQLSMRQDHLTHAGDHVFVKHGVPSSWADGSYVLVGQDAVDFDITLESVDHAAQVATVVVRHVPPAQSQIKLPAAWMLSPIGSAPNNWVEVEKGSDGKTVAEVGLETFEDKIRVSLATGRIESATMENPVEVLQRDCEDAALTVCGTPIRYQIRRQISLEAVNPTANSK